MRKLLFALLLPFIAFAAEDIELLHHEDFTKTAQQYKVEKGARIAVEGGALRIDDGLVTRSLPIPEGETLRFHALLRAENVRKKEKAHWKGTRFAILMGKDIRAGAPTRDGSFDWTPVSFKVDVPLGIKKLELQLGMKDAEGTLFVKDLTLEIIK